MAFKNVNQRMKFDGKKALTELAIGESFTGYFLNVKKYFSEEYDREMLSLLFQESETGKITVVYPAGNVKYIVNDGKLALGANTRITRNSDVKVKGKKSTNFTVEQDPDDTVDVEEVLASVSQETAEASTEECTDEAPAAARAPAGASKSEQKRLATLAKEKRLQEGA